MTEHEPKAQPMMDFFIIEPGKTVQIGDVKNGTVFANGARALQSPNVENVRLYADVDGVKYDVVEMVWKLDEDKKEGPILHMAVYLRAPVVEEVSGPKTRKTFSQIRWLQNHEQHMVMEESRRESFWDIQVLHVNGTITPIDRSRMPIGAGEILVGRFCS